MNCTGFEYLVLEICERIGWLSGITSILEARLLYFEVLWEQYIS